MGWNEPLQSIYPGSDVAMRTLTHDQLIHALKECGIERGDTLLIHSDLRACGLPEGLKSKEDILSFYYTAIKSLIGDEGTIAVPAYFYEYAREGLSFDVDHSPVSTSLGAFSQWTASQPLAVRSLNPLQSIAAIGSKASLLCGGPSLSGYGPGSPWQKLLDCDAKILFLGAPVQSMTFVHFIEQRIGVPHLYVKRYPYPVIKNGERVHGHPSSSVRYLDFEIQYLLNRFEKELFDEGKLIRSGNFSMVRAHDAYETGIQNLEKDPFYFLKEPPKFIEGKIPLDGLKGDFK